MELPSRHGFRAGDDIVGYKVEARIGKISKHSVSGACGHEGQGPAASVAGDVNFAGQPAAGASEGSFVEPPLAAACWRARTIDR